MEVRHEEEKWRSSVIHFVFPVKVAQTVTELLSSPRAQQPKIDANLILDNFLNDLKQSIVNRWVEFKNSVL